MMKEVMDPLTDAYYSLLNGQISYDGREVKGYPEDADNSDDYHHYLIRGESETDNSPRSVFITRPVVIIEIVTVFNGYIDKSVVGSIDSQIRGLVFPTRKCGLPAMVGLQIANVEIQSVNYLKQDDGTRRTYRKITRFIHRIIQT